MKEIVIDFNNEGNPTIKVNGVKGKSCIDVTKFLEQALGNKKDDTKTLEYYESINNAVVYS